MKLNPHYLPYQASGTFLLVPTGGADFSGVVRGNKTLGAILELLKSETSEEAIVDAMAVRFDAPREQIAQDVQKALTQLRSIGAIAE